MLDFTKLPRGVPDTHARTHGVAPRALWMSPKLIQTNEFLAYEPGKLFLGYSDDKPIGVGDDRHVFTVTGSRAGKGRSAIIPNLLLYPGSTLTLDPKGENARLTAAHRRDALGHDVYVIDPFDASELGESLKARFNPFDELDPNSDSFIDECATLADALITSASGEANSHWNNTGRMILRGLIAYVAAEPVIEYRDLRMVMELLHAGPVFENGQSIDGFKALLKRIAHFPELAHGVPADMANLLLSTGENEYGSLLSTVRQNLSFLASPKMRDCLSDPHRENVEVTERRPLLSEWKFKPVSIYLCLPAGLLHSHGRFFRL